LGEDAGLKIEDDHTLIWLPPVEALARLRHDAHAWAVSAWLRLQR
jgi:8-oxo-dGTP diphosphatase